MGKNIVILGGGAGGLVAANILRKRLSKEHRIILVDRNEHHLFSPSLLWLIFGLRSPDEVQRSFKSLLRKGIEFIHGEVTEISPEKKTVAVGGNPVEYNYLIISLGAELKKALYPKTEKTYNFYCLEGARLAGDAIKRFHGGKLLILIAGIPFKCPAAPYELAFLLDSFFKGKKLFGVEIELWTPETLPMPAAGPVIGNAIREMLMVRNIRFNPEHKVKTISEDKLVFENGITSTYDLLLTVPPHTAPEVVKKANLTDGSGWLPVDGETLKTRFENVYAIGDITTIRLPGQYKPDRSLNLPKAGVFAHYQAEVLAHNISAEIHGEKSDRKFSGKGYCFLELGNSSSGFARGNFYSLPAPQVKMYPSSRAWHLAKILFEKWWLWKWF